MHSAICMLFDMNATSIQTETPEEAQATESLRITKYTAEGEANGIALDELLPCENRDELFWIDVMSDSFLDDIRSRLNIPHLPFESALSPGSNPTVGVDSDYAWCRVAISQHSGNLKFDGILLDIFAGPGSVLTRHHKPVPFIDDLRNREHGQSRLGELGSLTFMGSLLHWVLESYFDAVMVFEAALDRIEADILEDRHDEDSVRLATMRKTAARLRRMLASHRIVFSSLSRPDFMPHSSRSVSRLFNTLEQQFQNAIDAVEGTRELVIGTLEVLTNRIALRTNKSLRLLSFAAGIFGFMSVVVGAMGMNFQTSFFDTEDKGFFITIGTMLVVSSGVLLIGARRKWF